MVRPWILKGVFIVVFLIVLRGTDGVGAEFSLVHVVGGDRVKVPVDVSVDSRGFFYLLDQERRVVDIVSPEGEIMREVKLPRDVGRPEGIAVKRPGIFFVADSEKSAVHEIGVSGRRFRKINVRRGGRVVDVAFFGKRIFVLDGKRHLFSIYDLEGEKMGEIGEKGGKPSEFSYPYRIDADENGLIYISDTMNGRIQIFNVDGKHVGTVKKFGLSRNSFLRPAGVTPYGLNGILITDLMSGLVYLWEGSSKTVSSLEWGREEVRFAYPSSIAYSPRGDLAVVDSRDGKMYILKKISE